MKLWKKHKKYILMIIILFFINYSKCQDSCTNNCHSVDGKSCVNKVAGDSYECSSCKIKHSDLTCITCTGLTSAYYSVDSSNSCVNGCVGDKIIYETSECTSEDLSSLYKLGSIYYIDEPSASSLISCENKICKCSSNYYYIDTNDNKEEYNCFNSYDPSTSSTLAEYKYYNYKTGQFFKSGCPDGLLIKKENGLSTATRCSDKCINQEYYVAYLDNSNEIIDEYCVDDCNPTSPTILTQYKYEYINNGVKTCLKECPSGTYIKDDSKCVPLSDCKFYKDNTCYTTCTDVPSDSGTTFNLYKYGSKECISSCDGEHLYKDETNNICYRKEDCNFIDESSSDKKCLSTCGNPNFQVYNTKLCVSSCSASSKNYYINDRYVCYSSCAEIPDGDYIYEGYNDNQCYQGITGLANCDVFYKKVNGIRKCAKISDCISQGYNYILDEEKECKESCNGYYKVEIKETIGSQEVTYIRCFNSLNNILTYSNTNYNPSSVNYCDLNLKECWSDVPDGYYINNNKIKSSPDKYEIVKECSYFYYESTISGKTYKKCVDSCKTDSNCPDKYFVAGNKICINDCSDINKYYYYETDDHKECLDTCVSKPDKPFSNIITTTNPVAACKSGCDSSTEFYNYNSYICLSSCANDYLYHKNTGDNKNICYPSCLDIPGRNHIYLLDDNSCITETERTSYNEDSITTNDCEVYYLKSDGVRKCSTPQGCKDLGYDYLKNDECKKQCDETDYKLDGTPLVKCFSSPSECLEGATGSVYYIIKSRKCWTSHQTEYFINSVSSYEYELVEKCEKYYYENSADHDYNYCISTCSEKSLYFVNGYQKCITKTLCVSDFNKYYYDPSNNECIETCNGRVGYGFQNSIASGTTESQECLSACTGTTSYYNFDSNVCLTHCGADGSNKKYHAYNKYICYSSCQEIPNENYQYETVVQVSSNVYVYACYTSAQSDYSYYYLKEDGTKKSATPAECKALDYIYIIGSECKNRCDNHYKLEYEETIEGNQVSFFKCVDNLDDCKTDDIPTAIYYDTKLKKCWNDWTKISSQYFINDAGTVSNPTKYEVVQECEHFYKTNGNKRTCKDECKETGSEKFFVSGKKNCEDLCDTGFNKHYYNPTNYECLDTCVGLPNNEFADKIIFQDDDNDGINDLDNTKPCKSECDGDQYYDSGSYICISNCGDNDANKIYHASDGDFAKVCYSSCAEIPGGQHIYEKDKICYTSQPTSCDFYYINTNGAKQCTTKYDCIKTGKSYFINKECKESCDGYYKYETSEDFEIEIESVTSTETLTFTICYDSETEVLNANNDVKYYSIESKLCWKEYPYGYFINEEKNEIGSTSTTPNKKYVVVKECEFFYYVKEDNDNDDPDDDILQCTSDCNSLDPKLYSLKGQKNCESDCSKFNKYYYNPGNNECLDTCKGLLNKEFANKVDTDYPVQECISECDNTDTDNPHYYDYDSNICVTRCGLDNANYLYYPNGVKICYPSCLAIPTGDYKYESIDQTDNLKICYTSITDVTDCYYYYMKDDGTWKCLGTDDDAATNCKNMNYNYLLGNECRKECNDFFILEDDNSIGLKKCFKTKDDCLSNSVGAKYYSTKLKKCWKNYPTNYYISKVDKDTTVEPNTIIGYEVVEECEYYYYKKTEDGVEQYFCTEKCYITTGDNQISKFFEKGKKNCLESCNEGDVHKFFYDPSTHECLDTCIGSGNNFAYKDINDPQECKGSCDSVTDSNPKTNYNYGENLCFSDTCEELGEFVKNSVTTVCYNSCMDIPGKKNIFESISGKICFEKNIITDSDSSASSHCPFYYPQLDGSMKCINSKSECKTNSFNYIYGKECTNNCDGYYQLMDVGNSEPIECYNTLQSALSDDDIIYYDTTLKKVWKDYHYDDDSFKFYIKYEQNNKFEVVENCENFYYKNGDNYYCIDNCQKVNLYFSKGTNQEIIPECKTCTKYYDPTNNECLDTCLGLTNLEYAYPIDDIETNTQPHKCLNKCDYYFIPRITGSTTTHYDCVDECDGTKRDSDNNPYKFIDIKTKECMTGCKSGEYLVDNNKCYPECTNNDYNYINTDTNECVLSCPSNLKKEVPIFEYTGGSGRIIYLCKSTCKDEEFRLEDKCLEKCPSTHPYIGYNKICQSTTDKCNADPNGKYYYPINEDDSSREYTIYKCIDSCTKAIITYSNGDPEKKYLFYAETGVEPNLCLINCNIDHFHYYLGNICIQECPDDYPFYSDDNSNHYECQASTICPGSGTDEYFLNGQCVERENCALNNKKYINSEKICLSQCQEGQIKLKNSGLEDGTYTCMEKCEPNYYEDKDSEGKPECINKCPKGREYIGKNNKCKEICEDEDGVNYYKFDTGTNSDSTTYDIYQCLDGCKGSYKYKEANNGKQCYEQCTDDYPYLAEDENLCYDNCLNSKKNPFTLNEGNKCVSTCIGTEKEFYADDKVCVSSCSDLTNTPIIGEHNKCVEKCDYTSRLKFQLDGECVESCETTSTGSDPPKKRYSRGDYICKQKCGKAENIVINGEECTNICDEFKNPLNVLNTADSNDYYEFECVHSCLNIGKYYYDIDKICTDACNTGDKIVQGMNKCISNCNLLQDNKYYLFEKIVDDPTYPKDMCVLNCLDPKPYIDNDICVDNCPSGKKFFVKESLDISNNIYKKCVNDCPKTSPYYTLNEDPIECKSICVGYFVPNGDVTKNATICLSSCPGETDTDGNYIYKYKIENDTGNMCYEECPNEAKYHFDGDAYTNDNQCYKECPETAPFHKEGEYICKKLSELESGYILYDKKEWKGDISSCPTGYSLTTKVEDSSITVDIYLCSNECINNEYGLYLTPYQTCVKDCVTSTLVNGLNLKNDEENKKCICKKLYHYDETTLKIKCYSESYNYCKDTANPNYPLPLHGSNQCLKTCSDERILNPSENDCYKKNTPCSQIDSYSAIFTKSNGQLKCECSYNFYIDSDEITKKCLAENDLCPQNKPYLITETKECVAECSSPYSYYFKNYCVKNCPSGTVIDGTTCNCDNKFWYQSSSENFVCLVGNCLDDYPVYIKDTKQCLKTCKGSHYPNLFNNICYKDCTESSTDIANIEPVPIESDLAEFKCDCLRPWYYKIQDDKTVMSCPVNNDNIKKCRDYTKETEIGPTFKLLYMIPSTKQCVENCPSDLPYYFNDICYENCDFDINIEAVENSYECSCQNLWYIDPNDEYELDKICYNKDQNECDQHYEQGKNTRYLINSTKECVDSYKKCPEKSFKFNSICYDKCPENTLESTEVIGEDTINICTCDKSHLWLFFIKYGNRYYKCGIDSCPETAEEDNYIRKNLLENQNQCVKSCTEDGPDGNEYLHSFRNICVEKCPEGTFTNYDICEFYDIKDKEKINDLFALKDSANIQAKELYDKSEQTSGYIMHDFDASLQIYAMNKLDNNKELIMKNNLTYIDPGKCLERIYEDNGLEDDDKIIVAKYDLLTRNHKSNNNNNEEGNNNNEKGNDNNNDNNEEGNNNNEREEGNNNNNNANNNNNNNEENIDNKYLINQVEYEFFIYSTMEKIYGTVCLPNEIEISYPIVSNKNKFNNYESGVNDNDYLKKFNIGKLLHNKDPEIDTFNKENKIYKDICIGVELNGKDLVLEERYNYLYPNNVSLCESNCTMKNTDFDLERINCMCTFKEVFDFNRIDEDTNNILNDPNFPLPTQSGANAQIIKCLAKLGIKEGITKNEAFYFCAAGSVIILSMTLVSAIHGVKSVGTFMNGMLGKTGANINNKTNVINSTSKFVNNPPKKNDEIDNDEMDEDEENEEDEKKEENIEKEINRTNIVIKKNIKMQYNITNNNSNNNSKNDVSDISVVNNKNINYGVNTKNNFTRNKNKTYEIEERINNTKTNSKYNTINIYSNKKAEFIPPEYNFKFFKPNDKGIVKRIERSQIPFEVDKDTKILLEGKQDVLYDENYLKGPFYEDQNILEIIDDNNIITNKNNKVVKFSDNNIANNTQVITKKRNIYNLNNNQDSNSAKKNNIPNNLNSDEKEFIKIKKINPITSLQMTVEEYKTDDEIKVVDSTTSIYNLMKREHTYLRATYEKYMSKNHPNILATFLAEILDKIYLIKIFIFLKKFEIFSIQLSLYIFYHILVLSLLCGFFTIKTIKRIWEEYDYPTINFYLLYGFLAHIIIWVIYRIFILLLDNQDRIRALVSLNNKNNNNINNNNQDEIIKEKYDDLMKKIKIQTAVFYIVIIIITAFCFIYLVTFFAIYTGTKSKVFKAYYISLIEIVLIKFIYGLCLASFRIAADGNEFKSLYSFVYVFDKYIS